MTEQICEFESAIVRASRTDTWTPSLRAHAETCGICAQVLRICLALGPLASPPAGSIPRPPDPRIIWLKASFAARQQRDLWISRIAGVAYAALAAVFAFGIYQSAKSGLSDAVEFLPTTGTSTTSISAVSVMLVSALLVWLLSLPTSRRTGRV